MKRNAPGRIRDAIIQFLSQTSGSIPVKAIEKGVHIQIGAVPSSSIRSYLRLNTPTLFHREARGTYRLMSETSPSSSVLPSQETLWLNSYKYGRAILYQADCFEWISKQGPNSIHGIITDPPYGLYEYEPEQQEKMRNGKGGVWRIPPSYDGHLRSPLPRFTTLTSGQLIELRNFFMKWGKAVFPILVPGAHIVMASNSLVSYIVSGALAAVGYERRGEIIRLTMTMRGGDRPKAAHQEFNEISVMPRSMWEPWIVFRKPIEGRVQDNLRRWKTGGFRRPGKDKPFGDVIASSPTRASERRMAPHPSLKPQAFLRQIVRAVLPLGEGIILDPFAGAGSTLAAAETLGYESIGTEKDPIYYKMACSAIPKLASFKKT